ncbi:amino acid permease [Terrilactibacillus sp. BCM23-1]|uniref:Amino acid permease n=1 Tax=Terrilactibacillus tamarindi TaxID=2599694 RepID=A0A6N8CVJ3_9BACI|nr:amino acid permease [Terrilactibacillus tamarindi]MTT33323.1 amino acid permease [Terrilactibacillus tamarindi]
MKKKQLNVWVLTSLVVGNMVGSAIFMTPSTLASEASPAGTLLAWILTGLGVLFIALVYGILSIKKPEISGGPQIYAKALFEEGTERSRLMGYFVTWGYYVANFVGNVAVITTFTGYLSTFFPVMNSAKLIYKYGDTTVTLGYLLNFLVSSALLWFVFVLILKGIQGAGKLNLIATAAKVIGFLLFILATLFVIQTQYYTPFTELQTNNHSVGLFGQVNSAAVTTMWAFIGVESAVVFSARAKSGRDIKRATIMGLVIALFIYIAITVLVMGTLPRHELVHSSKPLVDALSQVTGQAGGYILGLLALISLFGSSIGWILLSAEVPYQSAKQGFFLKSFAKENKNGTPVVALVVTCVIGQLFLLSIISNSISEVFTFMTTVATLSYLIPYIFASLYLLKIVLSGKDYLHKQKERLSDGMIASIATLFSLWIIKAGSEDLRTFLYGLGMIICGLVLYPFIKRSLK